MAIVLTNLNKLTKDTEAYVRGSLASNLLKITPIIGLKKTNEIIMPIFLELIKEEDHDIRMSLIKTLDKLNKVIRIDNIIQSILPSFVEINSNKS
jgi:serine/threonine-protein phosphatase 2A regulatory subunit A